MIEKEIDFSKMIGEITAISLEKNLNFVQSDYIEGKFILSGRYKQTVASQVEEEFYYEIPVEISLMDRMDMNSAQVDIVDFQYDIVNQTFLHCSIELSVDGVEVLEERECDGDPVETKEIELPHIEAKIEKDKSIIEEDRVEDVKQSLEDNSDDADSLSVSEKDEDDSFFFNVDEDKETYGTFVVYIVRQNETINSILEKYHVSIDEIEKYNDVKNITNGTKLIIPCLNEKNS